MPLFVVSTSIVLFYFNLLYCIQAELEDPFGDDYSDLKLRKLFLAPLTKDFKDISLALKASEDDKDEASNIFVKLVKDMSVMQFDDRASFRVVARSVDGDGEETPAAADGQFVALGQSAALVDALDALRAALLEKK